MTHRNLRVAKLVREELGRIILRELEFPQALATITDVDVDKKLENAKIKISVLPSSAAAGVLSELGKKAGELQHLLMKKINIKPMPRIRFEIDHGPEDAAAVEKALLGK